MNKQRNTDISAMTLWSEQWCAPRWLVNLNSGLRPKSTRMVSVFGLSKRLIQKVRWPITHTVTWHAGPSCSPRHRLSNSFTHEHVLSTVNCPDLQIHLHLKKFLPPLLQKSPEEWNHPVSRCLIGAPSRILWPLQWSLAHTGFWTG